MFASRVFASRVFARGAAPVAAILMIAGAAQAAPAELERNPPPTAKDWSDIGRLPDWSGVWTPNITDQFNQEKTNIPPWKPEVQPQIDAMYKRMREGDPHLVLAYCLPHGMPTWMLISHNAMEVLFTPGRVTLLGESDGNRIRRIYTDGRKHPDDPDLTIHGHSIGRWEGDTLVVDTVGIIPQAWVAVNEGVGVPNNGDMHITERIRLSGPDTLEDELTITAPKVLTKPWTTKRLFARQRARKYDIVEGQCVQGSLVEDVDAYGNQIFKQIPTLEDGGVALPPAASK